MINFYNLNEQTLNEGDAISFDGCNFGRNRFTCDNPSSFVITRNGTYQIETILNVAPTVAGQMLFNIKVNGSNITGGEISLPGTTIGVYENGSSKVIVNLFAGSRISITNDTATNPTTLKQKGGSIIIKRIA